ncbi:MAG: hypothetical protein EPO22_02350, partial [Dehalococcoidia bacterium]
MGKKLILLGVAVAAFALWGAHAPWGSVPSASADPWAATMNLGMSACNTVAGDPAPCNNDVNQDVGEVVTTFLHTTIDANGGSFYDAPETQITGVSVGGAVPLGDSVGSDAFTIFVDGAACSSSSVPLAASFTIYNSPITPAAAYPSLGYAKGLAGGENWATNFAANWIADFDDDNENNTPDYQEVGPIIPAGAWSDDSYPETTQDHRDATGGGTADTIVDGIQRAPLYLPVEETALGAVAGTRYFGVANILSGANLVPVDFVSFPTLPGGGTFTQIAIIGQGSGAGLLPGSPASSGTVTCPPFTSDIQIDGHSGSGAAVQTVSGSGSWFFRGSVSADYDGDGIANYNDNCDTIPNAAQTDTASLDGGTADGIGDACDHQLAPGVGGTATDNDGDGFANANDSCPESNVTTDTDKDGIPGVQVSITSTSGANPDVITTSAPHNLVTGDVISITGVATDTAANGTFTITVIDATHFSIPVAGTAAGAGGTVRGGCDLNPNVEGDGEGYGPSGPAPQSGPPPGFYLDHDWTDLDTFAAGANEGLLAGDAVQATMRDSNDNHVADASDTLDSDGDGTPDNADDDPLDPSVPADRSVRCGAATGGSDCDFDAGFPTVYGDACPDSLESGPPSGKKYVSNADYYLSPSSPWDFYSVPVPALF